MNKILAPQTVVLAILREYDFHAVFTVEDSTIFVDMLEMYWTAQDNFAHPLRTKK